MKKPLGTGGSVKAISSQLRNNTLIVNGDSFLDVNLNEVFFKKQNLMYLTITIIINLISFLI